MSWPGSSLPPGVSPPRRRRRTKGGGKRRRGPTSTERIMRAVAIKAGVYKPPKKVEAIGRCLSHAHQELGFLSPWDLAHFLDDLAARSPGKKGNVRLPEWKRPEGFRGTIIGVRCKHCQGRGCHRDDMMGWGLVFRVRISKRAARCEKHEAAPEPTTPAA